EPETVQWCREMLANSPIALRCLKAALNADCDGQAGLQELAGNATLLFYMTEEAQEGRDAYVERRKPNFAKFRRLPRSRDRVPGARRRARGRHAPGRTSGPGGRLGPCVPHPDS